ncbi:MAG: sialate O-acetylesterase [Planctomycetota bacterium]
MRNRMVVLCGIVVLSLMQTASAETKMVLDMPLERQVFQRNAQEWAEVKVAGAVPADATLVEAKAELGAGLRGKATDWIVVAQGEQIQRGKFGGSLKLLTGGWYSLKVRFRKSAADPAALGEASIGQVGVGDIYITAGQSNSVNYGHPRQKSVETLSVYFNGKQFTPAADPIPDACGGGGTPWPILGDMLSRTTRAPVCFRSATVNWVRVREWVPAHASGNIERLVERAKWFGPAGVRGVLWVQGEADAGRPDFTLAEQYEREAKTMIEFSRQKLGWPIDWFVAGTCYCPPQGGLDWKEGMTAVTSAQKALWDKGIALRGPDTNDLIGNANYRHDGIHFGPRGLLVHAERWYAALSAHYQFANPVTTRAK